MVWVVFLISIEGTTYLLPAVMIFLLRCTSIPAQAILHHLQIASPQTPRKTDVIKMMAQSLSVSQFHTSTKKENIYLIHLGK